MPLTIGSSHTEETTVTESNLAITVGSGLVEVFATPAMIALMEKAAAACIADALAPGQASVGTHLNVAHTSATPPGMAVCATATVTAVEGRKITFALAASDEAGEIGSGTHTRFIVEVERFAAKAREKAAKG